jgi:hypothetical protein
MGPAAPAEARRARWRLACGTRSGSSPICDCGGPPRRAPPFRAAGAEAGGDRRRRRPERERHRGREEGGVQQPGFNIKRGTNSRAPNEPARAARVGFPSQGLIQLVKVRLSEQFCVCQSLSVAARGGGGRSGGGGCCGQRSGRVPEKRCKTGKAGAGKKQLGSVGGCSGRSRSGTGSAKSRGAGTSSDGAPRASHA